MSASTSPTPAGTNPVHTIPGEGARLLSEIAAVIEQRLSMVPSEDPYRGALAALAAAAPRPRGSSFTLSRTEAVAVESLLVWTDGGFLIDLGESSPEAARAAIRRLQLEAAIREGGGWWAHMACPGKLDTREQLGQGACPVEFTLPADAAAALAQLLPIAFGDTLDGDVATVLALADRLGVELLTAPEEEYG